MNIVKQSNHFLRSLFEEIGKNCFSFSHAEKEGALAGRVSAALEEGVEKDKKQSKIASSSSGNQKEGLEIGASSKKERTGAVLMKTASKDFICPAIIGLASSMLSKGAGMFPSKTGGAVSSLGRFFNGGADAASAINGKRGGETGSGLSAQDQEFVDALLLQKQLKKQEEELKAAGFTEPHAAMNRPLYLPNTLPKEEMLQAKQDSVPVLAQQLDSNRLLFKLEEKEKPEMSFPTVLPELRKDWKEIFSPLAKERFLEKEDLGIQENIFSGQTEAESIHRFDAARGPSSISLFEEKVEANQTAALNSAVFASGGQDWKRASLEQEVLKDWNVSLSLFSKSENHDQDQAVFKREEVRSMQAIEQKFSLDRQERLPSVQEQTQVGGAIKTHPLDPKGIRAIEASSRPYTKTLWESHHEDRSLGWQGIQSIMPAKGVSLDFAHAEVLSKNLMLSTGSGSMSLPLMRISFPLAWMHSKVAHAIASLFNQLDSRLQALQKRGGEENPVPTQKAPEIGQPEVIVRIYAPIQIIENYNPNGPQL